MEKKDTRRTIPTRLTPEDIRAMKATALALDTTSIDIATTAVRVMTQTADGRARLAEALGREKKESLPS